MWVITLLMLPKCIKTCAAPLETILQSQKFGKWFISSRWRRPEASTLSLGGYWSGHCHYMLGLPSFLALFAGSPISSDSPLMPPQCPTF